MKKANIKNIVHEAISKAMGNNGSHSMPALRPSGLPSRSDGAQGFLEKLFPSLETRIRKQEEGERTRIEERTRTEIYKVEAELAKGKAAKRKDILQKAYTFEQDLWVGNEEKRLIAQALIAKHEDLSLLIERTIESKFLTEEQKQYVIEQITALYLTSDNHVKGNGDKKE